MGVAAGIFYGSGTNGIATGPPAPSTRNLYGAAAAQDTRTVSGICKVVIPEGGNGLTAVAAVVEGAVGNHKVAVGSQIGKAAAYRNSSGRAERNIGPAPVIAYF